MSGTYESISPHDFKRGDIITHYGMRLRIVTEPRETNHPINEHSPTISAQAVIENWEDVKDFVGNLAEVDASGNRMWTVQGNGLARYSRKVLA